MTWRMVSRVIAAFLLFGQLAGSGPAAPTPQVAYIAQAQSRLDISLVIPCSVNGHNLMCEIDTGNTAGLVVAPSFEAALGIAPTATDNYTMTANGPAQTGTFAASLGVDGHVVRVQGIVLPNYTGIPLIGLPALRLLGRYFLVDFSTGIVYFVSDPRSGTTR
jgi:predicted aspartyl protease